jgi:hypothetical protein
MLKKIKKVIFPPANTFLRITVSLVMLIGANTVFSQGKPLGNIDKKTYFQILDAVFTEHESKKPDVLSFANVRFIPSFSPESQITLVRTKDRAKVVCIKADKNLYAALSELLRGNSSISVETLMKTVRIETLNYDLTLAEGDKWLAELFAAIPKTVQQINRERVENEKSDSVSLILDGGFYYFSAIHGLNEIDLKLYDENPNKTEVTGFYNLTKTLNRFRVDMSNRMKCN